MSLVSLSIDRCTFGETGAFLAAAGARVAFLAARGFFTAGAAADAFVGFAAFLQLP